MMDAPALPEEKPYIVWLGEPPADDLALVGGKAGNLNRLSAHHPVPLGFCVTTAALAAAADAESPGAERAEVRRMPNSLSVAIADAYADLARRVGRAAPSVAVRSSAVDEDGQSASFAGQHETYLNVVGADAVNAAVEDCWSSRASQRAREYRRSRGLTLDDVRLAVLVQRLVFADAAAIVFSANPVSGDREEIVVNASWGLGESIVAGRVNPDTYRLRKADLTIRQRQLGDKRRMTVAVPCGTQDVDVPRSLRGRSSLPDGQIVELARLARQLENAIGWPVDVECAVEGDRVYLLQCRRITSLR